MSGFVYIMSNPAFPHLLKIGKSKKDPTIDRVSELNQTGVPFPFKVEYFVMVGDESGLEKSLHGHFADRRVNTNREFFELELTVAIQALEAQADKFGGVKYVENHTAHRIQSSKLFDEDWWWAVPSIDEIKREIELLDDINSAVDGWTPLNFALAPMETQPNVIQFLLECGADPNSVYDVTGATPLHSASENDTEYSVAICRLLLESGANINAQEKDGYTPLHTAAYNAPNNAMFLLNNSADPNIKNKEGETPIFLASGFREIESVKSLLRAGADPGIVDAEGRNAIFGVLESPGGQKFQTVKLLTSAGADPFVIDSSGKNLFHVLVEFGASNDAELVDYLLGLGVDPNTKDNSGKSALDIAREHTYKLNSKHLLARC